MTVCILSDEPQDFNPRVNSMNLFAQLQVFVSISVSHACASQEVCVCGGADRLRSGGRVCEGEWQGSLAVLLCFPITALSDKRMDTDLSIPAEPDWVSTEGSHPYSLSYYRNTSKIAHGKIFTLLCRQL